MALINILARLGIDSTSYQAGLKKAESAASAAGRIMRSHLAQAFTIAAVGKLANDVTKLAGRIKDSAAQFGLTVEETQKLIRVAEDSSLSFEMLAQSINKVTRQRAMAVAGDKNAIENFKALGVSVERASNEGVRSADIFFEIAEALKTADLKRQGAAIKILGDESTKMFAAMKSIGDLGPLVLIDEQQIEDVDRMGKAFSHMVSDVKTLAAINASETFKDFKFVSSILGGGPAAQAAAGAITGALALPMAIIRGLTPNKSMRSEATKVSPSAAPAIEDLSGFLGRSSEMVGPTREIGSAAMASGDPLAKIGGLFFGADNSVQAVQRQQLETLRRLDARVERIERAASAE